MKLVWDKTPTLQNGRNSEGSFIRANDDSILFAYSRYTSATAEDDDSCDIAVIRSYDEGESWTEPEVIVKAKDIGVSNIMSVSCIYQEDGSIGIYFIIKESDKTSTFGRAISKDGKHFQAERTKHNAHPAYYVLNNDRVERLSDGRLILPAARHLLIDGVYDLPCTTVLFVSEDDGKNWKLLPHQFALPALDENSIGMQEPGVIEHKDGSIRVWARTMHGSQFESYSYDKMKSFTWPKASIFTSPKSPMEIVRDVERDVLYAIYNPNPQSQLSDKSPSKGRTPLVIRKSLDDGKTWTLPSVIEGTPDRGLCYPAAFFTKDYAMLCSYCRGGVEDGSCLARLGIMKISLEEI